ncbi:hypothetical protein [Streptomyces sp. TP-A0356]|nr:hypothetical protein [Streptomyces sp. TP-A0356]
MPEHVHVRITRGLGVSESGELVEYSSCRCGASWSKVFQVRDEGSE